MLVMPVVGIAVLVLLPFVAGEDGAVRSRRPVTVLAVLLFFVTYGVLWWLGNVAAVVARHDRLERDADPGANSQGFIA